jgi:hypothetical protein
MNYAELTTRLEETTENNDPTFISNIPWFIKDAENRIYSEVNLPLERKNATSGLAIGQQYVTAPTDYLFTYGLAIVHPTLGQQFLLRKEVEYIREMYPLVSYQAAPKVYAQFDTETFIIGPASDATYTMELHYFAPPESIVTATTTWLGNNYPQLLFNGALLNAYVFMKGSADIMAYYKTAYDNDLATLKQFAGQRIIVDDYRAGRIA